MGSVPTLPNIQAGQLVTSGNLRAITNAVNFAMNPPMVSALQTVAQSVPANTWTALTFDTENYDTDGMHSTTSNTTRFTAQTAGRYMCVGNAQFPNTSGLVVHSALRVNGGTFINGTPDLGATVGTSGSNAHAIADVYLYAGDYVELVVYASAAMTPTTSSPYSSMFQARWVSAQ